MILENIDPKILQEGLNLSTESINFLSEIPFNGRCTRQQHDKFEKKLESFSARVEDYKNKCTENGIAHNGIIQVGLSTIDTVISRKKKEIGTLKVISWWRCW